MYIWVWNYVGFNLLGNCLENLLFKDIIEIENISIFIKGLD